MTENKFIGKYEILEKVGEGGMGAVYKAIHPTLKKNVIIKQLKVKGKKIYSQRFLREASIMIELRNDNIVPVYDHFREKQSYYIAMEYIDGLSVEDLIKNKKQINPTAAVLIFIEICKGLKHAHDRGIIHRDIKPDNVLISKEGEVKLCDFGIATAGDIEDEGLTKTGVVMGTPAYMSPEQIENSKDVDESSDIYSMGVMFYQMLTGEKPFPGSFTADSINKINKGIYVKPGKINPSVPAVCRHIIKKAMHHKKRHRYKNLQTIIDKLSDYMFKYRRHSDIKQLIKDYIFNDESSLPVKLAKKKKPVLIISGVIVISAIMAGLIFLFFTSGYNHELLDKKEYGSLEITVNMPEDYYKDINYLYASARIYREDETDKAENVYFLSVKKENILSKIKSIINKKDKTLLTPVLSTGKFYLLSGEYNLELNIENNRYFKSFFLSPRKIQENRLETEDKKEIVFTYEVEPPKPVLLKSMIVDDLSGESLYDKAAIFFKENDTPVLPEDDWKIWKRISDIPWYSSTLTSGKWYFFKYESQDYYSKEVSFYPETLEDLVTIKIEMRKIPGKLIISSNTEDLEILIDNRNENYIGGRVKEFAEYGKTTTEPREFMLPEGNYIVTVQKKHGTAANYQFDNLANTTIELDVNYNGEDESLEITKK